MDRLKIKYKVIKTRLTALGNNILCNEKACIVNTEFSAVLKKEIRTALNIKLRPVKILRLEVPGAVAVMNKNGCVVHNGISDEELKYIKELFETKCSRASVNFGSPYIKSGLIANNNGFVVSNATSGIEVNDIDKALGFLQ